MLDTFDWRLTQRGRLWIQAGRTGILVWEARDERRSARLRVTQAPTFALDLAEVEPWSTLSHKIGPRRLLERVELIERRRRLELLDAEEKVVARMAIVEATASQPDTEVEVPPVDVGPWIEVEELRGYPEGERVATLLIDSSALERFEGDGFDRAFAALGVEAGVDPSRFEPDLARLSNARAATCDALEALFEIVRVNEPGVRADVDVEFLHDLRVAVRRSRSLLSELESVFEAAALAPWSEELRWLGSVTGPLRDLDVFLLDWPELVAGSRDVERLEELREFAAARREAAHVALVTALDSKRFEEIRERWPSFLHRQRQSLEPVVGTIEAEVTRRLWRRFRRVLKRGRALERTSAPEAFHRVRIQGKKLRYLLELHRPLWPASEVRAAVKALKKFQDSLGSFNDAEVHAELVHEIADEGALSPQGLMAAGQLVEALRQRGSTHRESFFSLFEEFESNENLERYALLAGRTER